MKTINTQEYFYHALAVFLDSNGIYLTSSVDMSYLNNLCIGLAKLN